MKSRAGLTGSDRAITLGTTCLMCGLLLGYLGSKLEVHSGRKVNLKLSNVNGQQPFRISPAHVRQQYRHLQPAERSSISMHTIVPTGCDRWQDFQMAGLYWSFLRSGQPGEFTRICGCSSEELMHRSVLWLIPTWITQGISAAGDDKYPLYNKPWVLSQWFKIAKPTEDYFLVLDSDMIVHRPFLPEQHQVAPGWAAAQNIWYLQDLNAVIIDAVFPDLLTQRANDWLAEPGPGRRADEVAEFYFVHREDAQEVFRRYWEYTPSIREFMAATSKEAIQRRNRTTGGAWVAETHAYPLAAAASGVRHRGSNSSIFHVSHDIFDADPNAVHYCWNVAVEGHDWKWYKHWFQHFSWAVCPPWPEFHNRHRRGLFPHPPRPSLLKSQARSSPSWLTVSTQSTSGSELVKDLLNIEVVGTLNQAFCHLHHYKFCPRTKELMTQCGMADQTMAELEERWKEVERSYGGDLQCVDAQAECNCEESADLCRKTCGLCQQHRQPVRSRPRRQSRI